MGIVAQKTLKGQHLAFERTASREYFKWGLDQADLPDLRGRELGTRLLVPGILVIFYYLPLLNLCHSGAEIYQWNEAILTRRVFLRIRYVFLGCLAFYSGTLRRWYQWTDGTFYRWYQWTDGTNGTIDGWLLPRLRVGQTSGGALPQQAHHLKKH